MLMLRICSTLGLMFLSRIYAILENLYFIQYHFTYNLCDTILIIGSRYIICYRLYFLLCICHSNTDTRILYHRNIIKAVTTGYHIFP